MNWQLFIVLVLVALAATYLLRQHWRTWAGTKSGGCGGGCSCPSKANAANDAQSTPLIPVEQLTVRRRNTSSP